MPRAAGACGSDENDPKRTKTGLKSRSAAAAFGRIVVCHSLGDSRSAAHTSIQNNSGLPQGLAGHFGGGSHTEVCVLTESPSEGVCHGYDVLLRRLRC